MPLMRMPRRGKGVDWALATDASEVHCAPAVLSVNAAETEKVVNHTAIPRKPACFIDVRTTL